MTTNIKKNIRVRFAPSPTGPLHIGGARTALFNWLFARNQGGEFILRIEDTDIERSKKEYENGIIEGLKWLGFNWDEGPYRQSERLDIYEKYLQKLLNEGRAYYCFCSKEELEADRQAMLSQGIAPRYSGKCKRFLLEESKAKIKEGEKQKDLPPVIRFKMPSKEIEFNDLIRGKIKFNAELIGDIVIAKNLREPLYNFSVVVDDYEMKISHVIRGEDHLANTPKQIALQEALSLESVKYAHLPLILTPERRKMSKRYLDVDLENYWQNGYLTEAIVNFTALLGWHPSDEREIFSLEELTKEFDIKRVQKSGAVFNIDKLDWLNSQYIKKMDVSELALEIKSFIPLSWQTDEMLLIKAIKVEKERIKTLAEFKDLAGFFFELPNYDAKLLIWRETSSEKTVENLKILANELDKIDEISFNKVSSEKIIMPFTENYGVGDLLWPLRMALSGKQASPGPFEILEVLGKKESLERIKIAINKLKNG
ncbi:MAG: glutamate--tRNA ligase [Patescibacteria group bacterium]